MGLIGVLSLANLAAQVPNNVGGVPASSIGGVSSQVSSSQQALQAILQQRRALLGQELALRNQGADEETIQSWRQQHASELTSLDQQLQAWSASQPRLMMRPIRSAPIPADATPEMKEFLTNSATLANSRAQLHNQAVASGGDVDEETISQQWREQNSALLQRQQQLAQIVAQQQAQQPMSVPAAPQIPAGASPQLTAFLTARNALMQQQAQLHNQYLTADPATRQAAMQQWRQQNSAQFEHLQQLAQALTQAQSPAQTNSSN
jgi:hypothetical protein